jgi:mannose-6-phosphate isomerase-like protein (cupin superfamily)
MRRVVDAAGKKYRTQVGSPSHFWRSENIRVSNLGGSTDRSHPIVQVRFAEVFHIHNDHRLTVLVYRGQGKFRLGGAVIPLMQGDVVFVPHGTRSGTRPLRRLWSSRQLSRGTTRFWPDKKNQMPQNEIQEVHAKEVGVGNPSEERASS